MRVNRDHIEWAWQGAAVRLGVTRMGAGPTLLMLPALSSISTRGEMRPLQERLAAAFTTVAIDWPGFGDAPRPAVPWRPDAYRAFLADVLDQAVQRPFATVAAGHAAGYCLAAARTRPGAAGRLCLVAPTWRGPLPTVMGKRHAAFRHIARAGDLPAIGDLIYRLNVNPFMVRMMALGHVYRDPRALAPDKLAEKLAVTRAAGARHASIRFVTGELDPMKSREEFLDAARQVTEPILVIYGADTPPKSKAEMAELAALPNVRTALLPAGKLAIHEEFADEVAGALRGFLESM
ncbi:MAG TPA: alpha/beta hydrolase [Xanthobacteraceae bacterium]|jgi:pimeloyl-ACP methyl ester carboxylesterase|nr:alpha/beta hydrolase [Xanthobacteraceae bacterium]